MRKARWGYNFLLAALIFSRTGAGWAEVTSEATPPEAQEQRGRKDSPNIEAYRAFMQGWEDSGRSTSEANTHARQMFEHALALDPHYAAASAMLGWTYLLEWLWQWTPDPQALERALTLTQQAVTTDDSLPLGHMLLGTVYLFKRQPEQARVEEERAIALSPNGADGQVALAQILIYGGKPEEAIQVMEKALCLNPRPQPPYFSILGLAYYTTRRYEEAIAALQKALSRNPNLLGPHAGLAVTYSELNRVEEARAEATTLLTLSPGFSVEVWQQRLPYSDAAELDRFLAALRKAGLK